MDPLFGWTATALAAYLTGCDLIETATTTNDGLEVPSPGVSVRALPPLVANLAVNRTPAGVWARCSRLFDIHSAFPAEHLFGPRLPAFTQKVPRYTTAFLPRHSSTKPVCH